MNLKDKLQIYIITYNRKWYLERTLGYIFAENSLIELITAILYLCKSLFLHFASKEVFNG